MTRMATAIDTAKYLVWLAGNDEREPDALTPLRIQKLLYYVQGWSLAARGKVIFDDEIEAWVHGPVVRSVYTEFAPLENQAIPADVGKDPSMLPSEEKAVIRSVWEGYKQHSASALWEKTHSESPWKETYRPNGKHDRRCDETISTESLTRFFRQEYDKNAIPGLELDSIHTARENIGRDESATLEKAFAD